jgi:5-methylcytosine-specific restriction endonuclease McrBC regulatory subunit McrC
VLDVVVNENEPFSAELTDADVAFLGRALGERFHALRRDYLINHVVGHVVLPSGMVLRIRSVKAPAASVFAWAAYVDPLLRSVRFIGEATDATDDADVASVVARLFLRELLDAVRGHGLVRRYEKTRLETAIVRGRIDFQALARRAGNLTRTPCDVWERRPRTPTMRFLAAALERLRSDAVMRAVDPATLRTLQMAFADVPPAIDPDLLTGRVDLPRNEHVFEPSVVLARLIFRCIGLREGEQRDGFAFIVNLADLFERAVVRALSDAGIDVHAQKPLTHRRVNVDGTVAPGTSEMFIDAYCPKLGEDGLVIDAKYKHRIASANLQQVLAYCHVTGARHAMLVLPGDLGNDLRAFRFDGPRESVMVDVVELDVKAKTVNGWREAGTRFAGRVIAIADGRACAA